MALDQQPDWIQAFFNDEAFVLATMLIRSYYQRVCCNRQFDDTRKNHVYNILVLTLNIKGNLSPHIVSRILTQIGNSAPNTFFFHGQAKTGKNREMDDSGLVCNRNICYNYFSLIIQRDGIENEWIHQ